MQRIAGLPIRGIARPTSMLDLDPTGDQTTAGTESGICKDAALTSESQTEVQTLHGLLPDIFRKIFSKPIFEFVLKAV